MTHREPRPDLGVQIVLFYHKSREGQHRLSIRTRDAMGTPFDLGPDRLAILFEKTAKDLRAAAPVEPEPDPWARFEALEAETVECARDRALYGGPRWIEAEAEVRTVEAAREAFESSVAMAFRMSRYGHQVEALSPNAFVARWRQGYR